MPFVAHLMSSGSSARNAQDITGGGKVGVVASGTNQATAAQLSGSHNTITTSSASTGVLLPPCAEGNWVSIFNNSGQTIKVYTFETTGVTMNNSVAGSTGVSMTNHTSAIFIAPSYNTWFNVPFLPS